MSRQAKARSSAVQVDYAAWKAKAAAAFERAHEVNAAVIPERLWRRHYIQNLSPEQAAEQAAVGAHNTRSAFDWK